MMKLFFLQPLDNLLQTYVFLGLPRMLTSIQKCVTICNGKRFLYATANDRWSSECIHKIIHTEYNASLMLF